MTLPPTFCIYCSQMPDRRKAAEAHFRERGLGVTLFQGVHGETWGLESRHKRKDAADPVTPGHIGLTLTHWSLWQHLWLSGVPEALVVEDDAVFPEDFEPLYHERMRHVPPSAGLVYVGTSPAPAEAKKITRTLGPGVVVMKDPFCTHCYLVRRRALPVLMQTNQIALTHVDIQIAQRSLPRLDYAVFWPPLVAQRTLTGEWQGSCHRPRTWRDVQGWFDYQEVFDRAVSEASDGAVFVEVGVWRGKSTCYLAERIRDSGKRIRHVVVDTFAGDPSDAPQRDWLAEVRKAGRTLRQDFEANLAECGFAGRVEVLETPSVEAALTCRNASVDLVMLDDDHSYPGCLASIKAWLPKVRSGGLLAGHDLEHYGVGLAVREMFGERFERAGDASWPSWVVRVS